jgi:hypothetical protein
LISLGHDAVAVWNYTPRQLNGFLRFASRRRCLEAAERMALAATAARGDPKAVKDQIEKLSKD